MEGCPMFFHWFSSGLVHLQKGKKHQSLSPFSREGNCFWDQTVRLQHTDVSNKASRHLSNPPFYSNISWKLTLKVDSAYTIISKMFFFFQALFQSFLILLSYIIYRVLGFSGFLAMCCIFSPQVIQLRYSESTNHPV